MRTMEHPAPSQSMWVREGGVHACFDGGQGDILLMAAYVHVIARLFICLIF